MGVVRSHARRLTATLVGTEAVCALAGAPAITVAGSSASVAPEGLGFKTDSARAPASGANLVDNGGKVLPVSHTYALWWGAPSAWSSDVQGGIGTFFDGLKGSNFLGVAAQYMRGASISSTFGGSQVDTSAPPKRVTAATLGAEIAKVYGTALDPSGIYFVFTSNFPKGGNFCAWHSLATVGGQPIAVAYMPNTANVAGCDPGNLYGVSGSEGLRSLTNVTSHEYMEAITDTLPASGSYGWIDPSGQEIGDKCAWTFSTPVKLANRSVWQLQEEWSNAITGCVQGS